MAKKASKAAKAKLVQLSDASAARRRAVMRDVNRVLQAHGVRGKVSELTLTAGAATTTDCPPGQTKRIVCRKQPDGSTVCEEECV